MAVSSAAVVASSRCDSASGDSRDDGASDVEYRISYPMLTKFHRLISGIQSVLRSCCAG
jgi:hypothetical protein